MYKRTHVLLGNCLGTDPDEKTHDGYTEQLALKSPDTEIIGIDLKVFPKKPKVKNWVQIKANYIDGLSRRDDNSIDLIESHHSLGDYDRPDRDWREKGIRPPLDLVKEYTHETLLVAYDKLKPGGAIEITVHQLRKDLVKDAFKGTLFDPKMIEVLPLEPQEYEKTAWSRYYNNAKQKLFKIRAIK